MPQRPTDRRIALVLQGGGALGAYQIGVYQALHEHGFDPDWVAGTSIGAINGAIIAGNPAETRGPMLDKFWTMLSRADPLDPAKLPDLARQIYGTWSAYAAIWTGERHFFTPRAFPPVAPVASAETASYYDTAPLKGLLESVIDFDLLNTGTVRFSLGMVHVKSGRLRYFDNRFQRIGVEHIMASGALPPGFPAVEVDGELWWDGGVYSNTPLEVVLDDYPRHDTLCFMVDLFNAVGKEPRSIPEVMARQKDIQYATRSDHDIEDYAKIHTLRRAVQALHERLNHEQRANPDIRALAALGCHTTMQIVHLIYPEASWGELSTKDVDFSRARLAERRALGYRDGSRAMTAAPWEKPVPRHTGVVLYEIAGTD